ncbi:hypothetical protein PoB_000285100 [Plakobranchus ocellatus]|uniref:Uncharacterized protein n=1 Tax=Plakobranchus ocellatus TaxID=259542 RepID=A0AAV3Y1T9_9GAST|nr:hypothetical protein PoB_000285100 [Plakobranchus ocellatus]
MYPNDFPAPQIQGAMTRQVDSPRKAHMRNSHIKPYPMKPAGPATSVSSYHTRRQQQCSQQPNSYRDPQSTTSSNWVEEQSQISG